MLVDSWYDPYLGVVILVRVIDGMLRKGQQIKFMQAGTQHLVDRVGCFRPKIEQLDRSRPRRDRLHHRADQGSRAGARRRHDDRRQASPPREALPGFKEVQPVVFCGLFPVDANDFEKLRESICKLRLNDASFSFEMETQRGARLRLPLRVPGAAPSGDHPGAADPRIRPRPDHHRAVGGLPDRARPMAAGTSSCTTRPTCPSRTRSRASPSRGSRRRSMSPTNISASILKLCQDRRGIQKNLTYVGGRAQVTYELPLNEVVFDFYDRLKSLSKGYASFDYTPDRLSRGRPGQDGHPGQRGAGRRAEHDRPPRAPPRCAAAAWSSG